jgi:hypothetical protein
VTGDTLVACGWTTSWLLGEMYGELYGDLSTDLSELTLDAVLGVDVVT